MSSLFITELTIEEIIKKTKYKECVEQMEAKQTSHYKHRSAVTIANHAKTLEYVKFVFFKNIN